MLQPSAHLSLLYNTLYNSACIQTPAAYGLSQTGLDQEFFAHMLEGHHTQTSYKSVLPMPPEISNTV